MRGKIEYPKSYIFAHPIQSWIFENANLIVTSLKASFRETKVKKYFKEASSRLLFNNEIKEFDQNLSAFFMIKMSAQKNGPSLSIKALSKTKSVYILYDDNRIFYLNPYSELIELYFDKKFLPKIHNLFPRDPNQLSLALIENLEELQNFTKHSPLDLVEEFKAHFNGIDEKEGISEFFRNSYNLIHFLFSPIYESSAWEKFAKKIEIKEGDKFFNMIAGAFTYKISTLIIKKYHKEALWNEELKQRYNAITKICATPSIDEFRESCEKLLKFDVRLQISNNLQEEKTQNEKLADLLKVRENIYSKLLPDATEIYKNEIRATIDYLNEVLIVTSLENPNSQESKSPSSILSLKEIHSVNSSEKDFLMVDSVGSNINSSSPIDIKQKQPSSSNESSPGGRSASSKTNRDSFFSYSSSDGSKPRLAARKLSPEVKKTLNTNLTKIEMPEILITQADSVSLTRRETGIENPDLDLSKPKKHYRAKGQNKKPRSELISSEDQATSSESKNKISIFFELEYEEKTKGNNLAKPFNL
ncbi:MAG: hypothetical protein H0U70_03670 [Tatlockia sp.]|nr:hypothetical protein [Tatlockia sp.]